jgi:hypothetical protein
MSQDVSVYDLGNADAATDQGAAQSVGEPSAGARRGAPAEGAPPAATAARRLPSGGLALVRRLSWLRRWPGLTRSLSLFLPGAGQLVRGDLSTGLFLLTMSVFLVSLAWAILETLDRLAVTLELLGISIVAAFWTLGAIYVLAAALHLTGVLSVVDEPSPRERVIYHPALTGVASALLPGWGQLLNGDRVRAGLFLGCVWIAAGIWVVASPAATELLSAHLPAVSRWEQAARNPGLLWVARFTFPALLWALAVYDAAASSIHARRS